MSALSSRATPASRSRDRLVRSSESARHPAVLGQVRRHRRVRRHVRLKVLKRPHGEIVAFRERRVPRRHLTRVADVEEIAKRERGGEPSVSLAFLAPAARHRGRPPEPPPPPPPPPTRHIRSANATRTPAIPRVHARSGRGPSSARGTTRTSPTRREDFSPRLVAPSARTKTDPCARPWFARASRDCADADRVARRVTDHRAAHTRVAVEGRFDAPPRRAPSASTRASRRRRPTSSPPNRRRGVAATPRLNPREV